MDSINCNVEFLNELISNITTTNNILSNYISLLYENVLVGETMFDQLIEKVNNRINQFSMLKDEINEKYISNCNLLECKCEKEFYDKINEKNQIFLSAIKNIDVNIEQLYKIKNTLYEKKSHFELTKNNIKSNISLVGYMSNDIYNDLQKTLSLLEKYTKFI